MKRVSKKYLITLGILLTIASSANADQLIQDDLVVSGSECIGVDCASGEEFGYDTLRMKENNLRIRFTDTSGSGSFPSGDWQITVNDSANGGSNYFAIDDIDYGRRPFTIMQQAGDNALYVNQHSFVGLGTNLPQTKLHMKYGNTPTIRLEQDSSSGWSAATWDIGANETYFFLRDYTNNRGQMPVKIRTGTRNNALYIAQDGDIGIGTSTPDVGLDMVSSIPAIRLGNTSDYNGNGSWSIYGYTNEFTMGQSENGSYTPIVHIKRNSPTKSLVIEPTKVSILKSLDVNESVTVGGSLTVTGNILSLGSVFNASDKNLKENIVQVNNNTILKKVDELNVSFWNYKKEDKSIRHIGPMAQDFYKIFKVGVDNKHISSLDAAAVAIASVKALNEKLQEKDAEIAILQTQVQELKKLEARMEQFEAFMKQEKRVSFQSKEKKSLMKKYQDSEDATETIDSSTHKAAQIQQIEHFSNGRDLNKNND